jgi:hypothetical protein
MGIVMHAAANKNVCIGLMVFGGLLFISCDHQASQRSHNSEEYWEFKVEDHGFSLKLPKGWKQKKKDLDFYTLGFGSPMLTSVKSVKKQSFDEFQKSANTFREMVQKSPDYLKEPKHEKGETKAGNPYEYLVIHEKGQKDDTYYYIAVSHVWLKNKKMTVQLFFEGQGKMLSKVFQAKEHAAFEKSARSICLSPE